MEIAAKYDPKNIEDKWYDYWMKNEFFKSIPNEKESYTIVIPPPNVTGVLHMGHMLNNSIQDILIRRARMKGYNALWVPGTDHASIATEAKVVALLKEKGIEKNQLSRDEFMKYAWEWKEKHGGIILQQLRKLGASCDWNRTKFTMDPEMSESVIDVFIDLYHKGKIYRGVRMVNWDPKALTAISDEEVIYQEVNSKLYYVRYQVEGTDEYITIATTRPETILGDSAVCVHPEDERYAALKGKRVIVPLVNRSVPLIFDEYVDREFGTGALKITPAHDINDYNLGIKYKLEVINIFNDNGTLNEQAQLLVGTDRFQARKEIIPLLENAGNLVKIEDYVNKVGYSERTNEVIEPKLSLQWFCKMDEMAKPALEAVMKDNIRFFPEKFKNTYAHWMENVKDWCISRQLWWGQRIPAYHLPNHEYVVAKTAEEALRIAQEKYPQLNLTIDDLKQDEDVMDTWFSSWLWPLSVFDGIRHPNNPELDYYYPTAVLVTAPEIIFFWVARMIMAGFEWKNGIPFKDVYFTGIVRDKLRRKMSKSLGNSPDALELIAQYGADGVRFGMLCSSPAGNDLLFDESLCEQGRNFNNKIWNAFRLVSGWDIDEKGEQPLHTKVAVEWINQRISQVAAEIEHDFEKYRLSDALMAIYKLIWDDFCSYFLEVVKPPYQHAIDAKSYGEIIDIFEKLMLHLHPFMPFITEELWQNLKERKEGESIMVQTMPVRNTFNSQFIDRFANTQKIVEEIRRVRAQKNIPQKNKLDLLIMTDGQNADMEMDAVIVKLCNLEAIQYIAEKPQGAVSFIQQNIEYFIPVTENINVEEELVKLTADLEYAEKFLQSVLKKLSNEKFVSGAPEAVVNIERKKQSDTEEKIRILKEQIANLNQNR
ncbi:valine--tRNA ligase [Bacteroidales bacterium OttesenSCG-928-B11]|nr:valine--tRNA ligase [Bacteroidales bacterium OttesenSCG-928-B11]MDL2325906.1 valine--tRNA ligase [Bacteroidales bacterium OttesenSCG-928-A14]